MDLASRSPVALGQTTPAAPAEDSWQRTLSETAVHAWPEASCENLKQTTIHIQCQLYVPGLVECNTLRRHLNNIDRL
jgi:hypothetical protein